MREFIWFTRNSWTYMRGHRVRFFIGFLTAWRTFYRLSREDRSEEDRAMFIVLTLIGSLLFVTLALHFVSAGMNR